MKCRGRHLGGELSQRGESNSLGERDFQHILAPGPFDTTKHIADSILIDAHVVSWPHFGQIRPLLY